MSERRDPSETHVPRSPALVKEVAAPVARESGLGILMVASIAMLFAVASAALVLRAQMASPPPCPYASAEERATEPAAPAPEAVGAAAERRTGPCGEAVYKRHADGSVTVVYELCGAGSGDEDPDGIEIRAVHPR